MRFLLLAAVAFALVMCGGSTREPAGTLGPDAGAGCDSSIHAHCTFPEGFGLVQFGSDPGCIEYSGASPDHSACHFPGNIGPQGEFSEGPCPRSEYEKACTELDSPAPGAGSCEAFETVWSNSPAWNPDAGIIGFPTCLSVVQ